jgi:CDP-glucose 4,6-dehydratase
MVINAEFWRGRRVFVTGHTGFKGAWLSLWLQQLGAEVFGYSLAPASQPNLYDAVSLGSSLAGETIADIRDGSALSRALLSSAPEIVLHLAAQAIVLNSYADPVETFSTNVVGTVTLLDALRKAPSVRAAIMVTSDKCYENREWLWGYREDDAMGGHDPYSASKGAAEIAVTAMRRSFFATDDYARHHLGLATVRAGNVIGGGDWAEHRLIPDLLRAISAGQPCVIRNPASIRPWQHVLDPLSGYLVLAEALWRDGPGYAGAWNFGPHDGNAHSVGWLTDRLLQLWDGSPGWAAGSEPTSHEAVTLKLDIAKATSLLPWRPVWSLETALDSIVTWYKAFQQGDDMQALSLRQIAEYCRDAAQTEARRP